MADHLPLISSRQALLHWTTLGRLEQTLTQEIRHSKGVGLDGLDPSRIPEILEPESQWRSMLRLVQLRMRSGQYTFTPYREVLIPKGRGQAPRLISIPTLRDRLVLKTLTKVLRNTLGISGPPIAQRVADRAHRASQVRSGYVRIDIREYFASVPHDKLLHKLRQGVRSRAVTRIISEAIRNPTLGFERGKQPLEGLSSGIPQGISASSALAELFLHEFDQSWSTRPEVTYFRFVDDVLILCEIDKCMEYFLQATRELASFGLATHPLGESSKSSVGRIADSFDFLGYTFNGSLLSIAPRSVTKIENLLAQAFSNFRTHRRLRRLGWDVNRLAAGSIYKGEHRGWIKFYARADDARSVHHLDWLVKSLMKRHSVPPRVRFKSFVRTYHIVRFRTSPSPYVPEPEKWTLDQKRNHLVDVEGWARELAYSAELSDVSRAFDGSLARDLLQLERDLDPSS